MNIYKNYLYEYNLLKLYHNKNYLLHLELKISFER